MKKTESGVVPTICILTALVVIPVLYTLLNLAN